MAITPSSKRIVCTHGCTAPVATDLLSKFPSEFNIKEIIDSFPLSTEDRNESCAISFRAKSKIEKLGWVLERIYTGITLKGEPIIEKVLKVYDKYPVSGTNLLCFVLKEDEGLAYDVLEKENRILHRDIDRVSKVSDKVGGILKAYKCKSATDMNPKTSLEEDGPQYSKLYSKTISELRTFLNINSPIIYINEHDFSRVDTIIGAACSSYEILEWTPAIGVVDFKFKNPYSSIQEQLEPKTLSSFLQFILQKRRKNVIVLKDVQDYFGNNSFNENNLQSTIACLHQIAQRKLYDGSCEDKSTGKFVDFDVTVIVVTSKRITLPAELLPYVSYLDIPLPDEDEIDAMITHHLNVNNAEILKGQKDSRFIGNSSSESDKELVREKLKMSLKGLPAFQIDRLLDMAISKDQNLTDKDPEIITEHKRQLIKNSGLLELVENCGSLEDVGGLKYLKDYLKKKGNLMNNYKEASDFGLTMPKGVMLVGIPGCGKSMCAKAAAYCFNNVPLLKMDVGTLKGKYVGESESNMREAIKMAEAAAPCILWIDEIEKAFAGAGDNNGHETTKTMFGYFLSWLQDRKSSVYVIATANKYNLLPPEFRRKGRFDEVFYLNLPDDEERKLIFNSYTDKVGLETLDKYDSAKVKDLIKETNHCNGADIKCIVENTLEEMFLKSVMKSDKNRVLEILLKTAKNTIGINKSCADDLKNLKEEISKNFLLDANTGKIIEPEKKEEKKN